jgi:DNA processing protein
MEAGFVERDGEKFPEKLRMVKPMVRQVWYRGEWKENIFEKCVAVVGSRKMSRYGKQALGEIIPRLVGSGYSIVSGLMYGVDQEAHKLTLECGGKAIAVLGYGLGARSEEGARKLADKIVESGGVVISEYPELTVPKRWMFLQRNRIVVALSDIVIVAEAGEKSGSLHTAGLAKKNGKDLYAIPGSIFSPTSLGTNNLVTGGTAKALTTEALNNLCSIVENGQTMGISGQKLLGGEQELVTLLKIEGPMGVNELARALGEGVGEVLARLMKLEMKGVIADDRGTWKML